MRSQGLNGVLRAVRPVLLPGLVVLLADPAVSQTLPESVDCIACHLELADSTLSAPAVTYETDVHAQSGFGCLVCHGGPRTGRAELDPSVGFLSRPSRTEIPALCGRCHSDPVFMRDYDPNLRVDQVQEYFTSTHGRLLASEGDPDVATCVSCHPAHRILPPSDLDSSVHPLKVAELCGTCHADEDLMDPRGVPTDQLEEYHTGIHAELLYEEGDLSAPTCNDCHGNHGAAPPGFASVRNVCGQCHVIMADFFAASGHVEIFDETDRPGCSTCHGNHAIEVTSDDDLSLRTDRICADCHEPGDPDGEAFLVVSRLLDSLIAQRTHARELLESAEDAGMEVSQALFELEGVDNALTMARSAVHTFHVEPVAAEVDQGLQITETAVERGREALDEHGFRRVGLAVSAGIILLLIVALTLRMREIESRVDRLFESMDAFFEDAVLADVMGSDGADRREALRVAACGVLLEIALADSSFTEDERDHLERVIRTQLEMGEEAARRLVALAEAQHHAGAGLHRFTILINRHFDRAAKEALLDAMWSIVYADGVLTAHEAAIMNRVTDLLDLPSTERRP